MATDLKIGLAGWATPTGLGYEHRELYDLGMLSRWLVVSHPKLGIDPHLAPPPSPTIIHCRVRGQPRLYAQFLAGLDVLLFCERPVLEGYNLVAEARRRNIYVVCAPNMEWLPDARTTDWVRQVHLMWGPTQWSVEFLQSVANLARKAHRPCEWEKRIHGGFWGVNLSRFPYTPRSTCRSFLFTNGWGGAGDRKGIHVVTAAAALVPDIPIRVLSQKEITGLPPNCQVTVQNLDNPADLYADGDVFLAPSRWEGIGLQLYEAQAAGLPVVTTSGRPMDECLPFRKIRSTPARVTLHGRAVISYEADPQHLAKIMRELHGQDISAASREARSNMEQHFSMVDVFAKLRKVIEGEYQKFRKRR